MEDRPNLLEQIQNRIEGAKKETITNLLNANNGFEHDAQLKGYYRGLELADAMVRDYIKFLENEAKENNG